MDKRVISAIEGYIFDLFEPSRNWPEYEFKKRSYKRWAANEILKRVQQNADIPPIELVADFVCTTETFWGIDHEELSDSFIFSCAYDVATDILDILKAMN